MSKKKNQAFTVPSGGMYTIQASTSIAHDSTLMAVFDETADQLNRLMELVDKNIECGLLLDWDVKVKDTSLARKMYPDHVIRKGWLYGKE